MSVARLACVGLLLPWAMQTCLADQVQPFGTAHGVFSTVDSDGAILFTNIPPAGGVMASDPGPAAYPGKSGPKRPSAIGPVSHAMAHTATLQASILSEPQQPEIGQDDAAAEEIPPQLRDGGPPPDDH